MSRFGQARALALGVILVVAVLGACDAFPSDDPDVPRQAARGENGRGEGGRDRGPGRDPGSRRTHLVTHVVDGDTIDLANGETVRLVGIDTPERGECGYEESTAHLERLVLGRRVRLGESDEDRDRYDRLLRYVDVGPVDAGLEQIRAGYAVARFDSRDGYGRHPREDRYVAADAASPGFVCP